MMHLRKNFEFGRDTSRIRFKLVEPSLISVRDRRWLVPCRGTKNMAMSVSYGKWALALLVALVFISKFLMVFFHNTQT